MEGAGSLDGKCCEQQPEGGQSVGNGEMGCLGRSIGRVGGPCRLEGWALQGDGHLLRF